jgi:hypothetical protein
MSGINFLSNNLLKSSTLTLTTGTENAQFPLDNLKNDSPSVKFRSTGNTVVVEVDLLTVSDIDTLTVIGDATEAFGMTAVTYKTSVTTDFSGSPVNAVTLDPSQNIGYSYITSVTHRFVEITFTGQGSYVQTGGIFIGERINIEQNNLSVGSFNYNYSDKASTSESPYGQKFINERILQKTISGTLEFCTKSEQEILDDMYIKHGRHEPLWMIVDKDADAINSGDTKLTIYGYLNRIPVWSASGGQTYNSTVRIKEAT